MQLYEIDHPVQLLPGVVSIVLGISLLPAGTVRYVIKFFTESGGEVVTKLFGGGVLLLLGIIILLFTGRLLDAIIAVVPPLYGIERLFRRFPLVRDRAMHGLLTERERNQFESTYETAFGDDSAAYIDEKLDVSTEYLIKEGQRDIAFYYYFDRALPSIWFCLFTSSIVVFLSGYTSISRYYWHNVPVSNYIPAFLLILSATSALFIQKVSTESPDSFARAMLKSAAAILLFLAFLSLVLSSVPALPTSYMPAVTVYVLLDNALISAALFLCCFLVEHLGGVYHNRRIRKVAKLLPAHIT